MEKLTPEEVKVLIKAAQIAKEKGITKGASVKEICEKAGISRKTGYQWVGEADASVKDNEDALRKFSDLEVEHQKISKKYAYLKVENEGIRLAMEIHGFDELVKKNSP
jgi:transposase-like protein